MKKEDVKQPETLKLCSGVKAFELTNKGKTERKTNKTQN